MFIDFNIQCYSNGEIVQPSSVLTLHQQRDLLSNSVLLLFSTTIFVLETKDETESCESEYFINQRISEYEGLLKIGNAVRHLLGQDNLARLTDQRPFSSKFLVRMTIKRLLQFLSIYFYLVLPFIVYLSILFILCFRILSRIGDFSFGWFLRYFNKLVKCS